MPTNYRPDSGNDSAVPELVELCATLYCCYKTIKVYKGRDNHNSFMHTKIDVSGTTYLSDDSIYRDNVMKRTSLKNLNDMVYSAFIKEQHDRNR